MTIPGSANPLLLKAPAGGGGGEYTIERSVRFNSSDSASLSRTPSSAGNRRTWTWSSWVKRGKISNENQPFLTVNNGSSSFIMGWHGYFSDGRRDGIEINNVAGAADGYVTTGVFRDPSAWYHIVVAFDSTLSTASDRIKIWVNGEAQTFQTTYNGPSQNQEWLVNSATAHTIGDSVTSYTWHGPLDSYLADVHFIDGQALAPTDFGEFDTNDIWQPKAYTGTYGTNGFHLDFSDNSTAAALGTDTSGNGNDWTVNNISNTGANSDSLLDSPTNGTQTDTGAGGEVSGNYATWNPLTKTSAHTLSNGNLDVTTTAAGNLVASIFLSSGKWYWEVNSDGYVGITGADGIGYVGSISVSASDSYGYWSAGAIYSGVGGSLSGGSSFSYSDTIGVALDIDGNNVKFYKNGVQQYSIALNYSNWEDLRSGVFPSINGGGAGTRNFTLNAGQRPFAYTAPSGYKALCTANFTTPTIEKGSDYFDTTLYTGNGSTQTISGLDFSPDFVWIKRRNGIKSHRLQDVIRGTYYLESDTTAAEVDAGAAGLTTFNSDGFTLGGGSAYNALNATYAAWTWDAGSSTVTNTDGSITSTVRANPSAGFSIVTWTGTANATVGHGLNAAPQLVITKSRTNAVAWRIWSAEFSNAARDYLGLHAADAVQTFPGTYWGSMTSTTIGMGTGTYDNNTGDMVAYCFAPVDGYSSFGSYTGNGSADGPFVYTGFRPRFLLTKSSTGATNWHIVDSERGAYNVIGPYLTPNASNAEINYGGWDLLSNGFKFRNSGNTINSSGATYIYAAFAENPFSLARAR